jgi:hypothetical protein
MRVGDINGLGLMVSLSRFAGLTVRLLAASFFSGLLQSVLGRVWCSTGSGAGESFHGPQGSRQTLNRTKNGGAPTHSAPEKESYQPRESFAG